MEKTTANAALFITMALLCTAQIALAFNDASIEDMLFEDHSMIETIRLHITDNNKTEMTFLLPAGASAVAINGQPSQAINSSVRVPLQCKSCDINISYTLHDAAKQLSSDYHSFSRTLDLPANQRSLNYAIYLPQGYGLGSADPNSPSVIPAPTSLQTDGKSIIISWSETDLSQQPRYYVSYHQLERNAISLQTILLELSEWPVWAVIIVALIVGFAAGYIFNAKSKRPAAPGRTIPSPLLSPDEKAILKVVRENGAPMNQKEIGKELGWSKSKVSGIMSNLEYKEIVRREKLGRNYKVELIKDVEE